MVAISSKSKSKTKNAPVPTKADTATLEAELANLQNATGDIEGEQNTAEDLLYEKLGKAADFLHFAEQAENLPAYKIMLQKWGLIDNKAVYDIGEMSPAARYANAIRLLQYARPDYDAEKFHLACGGTKGLFLEEDTAKTSESDVRKKIEDIGAVNFGGTEFVSGLAYDTNNDVLENIRKFNQAVKRASDARRANISRNARAVAFIDNNREKIAAVGSIAAYFKQNGGRDRVLRDATPAKPAFNTLEAGKAEVGKLSAPLGVFHGSHNGQQTHAVLLAEWRDAPVEGEDGQVVIDAEGKQIGAWVIIRRYDDQAVVQSFIKELGKDARRHSKIKPGAWLRKIVKMGRVTGADYVIRVTQNESFTEVLASQSKPGPTLCAHLPKLPFIEGEVFINKVGGKNLSKIDGDIASLSMKPIGEDGGVTLLVSVSGQQQEVTSGTGRFYVGMDASGDNAKKIISTTDEFVAWVTEAFERRGDKPAKDVAITVDTEGVAVEDGEWTGKFAVAGDVPEMSYVIKRNDLLDAIKVVGKGVVMFADQQIVVVSSEGSTYPVRVHIPTKLDGNYVNTKCTTL